MFSEPLSSGSLEVDERRAAVFASCVDYWRGRRELEARPRSTLFLVARVARLLDRNLVDEQARPLEVIRQAANEHVERMFEQRLELAAFVDRFGDDLELLVASYCAARRAA
jgi:hypothetical protein